MWTERRVAGAWKWARPKRHIHNKKQELCQKPRAEGPLLLIAVSAAHLPSFLRLVEGINGAFGGVAGWFLITFFNFTNAQDYTELY